MEKKIRIYGTLGPACEEQGILEEMFRQGMTGIRLNLSHMGLKECESWLKNVREAARRVDKKPELLIDLQGPELRVGTMEDCVIKESDIVLLGEKGIPVPQNIFPYLKEGQQILLDDGKILLEVIEGEQCKVLRGGVLKSRKSIALPGVKVENPTLTENDLCNLKVAKEFGVTGVMLPFVRDAEDLKCLRQVLQQEAASDIRIFAKIENKAGFRSLPQLLPFADEIVIARGDLGNDMPLWELPRVQYEIGEMCKAAGKPYMVVTQMLASMEYAAVPTRAEVSDIFYAILHGASSVMLTGETAAGAYPAEAMKYMSNTVRQALRELS